MKISLRKRIIAFMLSVILLFSGSISGFASELLESEPMAEAAAAVVSEEATEPATEPATEAATEATETSAAIISEEITEATEAVTEEVTEAATEAVTEEATEAAAKEETVEETEEEIVEETETESVEETEEETEESEEETVEETEEEKDINLQTTVNGTVIKMTGPSSSFPEGTDYSISATELTSAQENDVEAALRKMELESETKVVSYQAYDIKLIVDGNEVQPLGEVKVTFEGGAVEKKVEAAEASENIEVFHIDETAQKAQPIINEVNDNAVEMTTDHFSTYVITITTRVDVTVTVEHYQGEGRNAKQLYRTREYPLTFQTRLEEIAVLTTHYDVAKIVKINGNTETVLYQANNTDNETVINQVLEADAKYRVYYTPTTDTESGGVQMFDYQVSVTTTSGHGPNATSTKVSINDESNYPNDSPYKQRLSVGSYRHTTPDAKATNGRYINRYESSQSTTPALGIVTGINYQTGALYMGSNGDGKYYEPGLFTQDAKIGKHILKGYDLQFSRNGDVYKLTHVLRNGAVVQTVNEAGKNFFPLDNVTYPQQEDISDDRTHNFYFGMRYDISFKIGEYVGDLNYTFSGDDDVWVILDAANGGGTVVIDVGGLHQPTTGTADLWSYLDPEGDNNLRTKRREDLTAAELAVLEKEHTLTILYMERGASDSNCSMNFTLPNSRIVDPVINNVNFALNIEKTVSGLTEDEFNALKQKLVFKVTPTNGGKPSNNGYALFNEAVKEISAADMGWTLDTTNQKYIGTYTLNNANSFINQFEYTVSEENEVIQGYDISTLVTANGETVTNPDIKAATIVFDGQNTTKTVDFENIYTPQTTEIEVTKLWKDAGNAYGTRPETISFKLKWNDGEELKYYPNNDKPEIYTITKASQEDQNSNTWTYKVEGLPKYKDGKEIQFQVEEIVDGNVAKYYSSSSNGTVMTNRFKVEIVKVSSSSNGQSSMIPLKDAEFTLGKAGGTTYYGKSNKDGLIVWYSDNQFNDVDVVSVLEDGTYTFRESKAPTGYAVSTESWEIEVIDGVMKLPEGEINKDNVIGKVYTAYFENEPLYALPSSGGFGIYWYMVAGVAMMMLATAIQYKNRRKEVLERIDKR